MAAEGEAAATASESSVTVQTPSATPAATLETQTSNEATIESNALGGTESTCATTAANAEASDPTPDDEGREKTLEFAEELMERGSKAIKESDYAEAADCFSRALEIRVSHYGELAHECVTEYYQYGRALLYKAQEEADPLVSMPKKDGDGDCDGDGGGDGESKQQGNAAKGKDGSGSGKSSAVNGESSTAASASSNVKAAEEDGATNDASGGKEDGGEDGDSEDEDLAEGDEDDSDLDLAWKMLDIARAIAEKHTDDTMDKVDILSALAEVALEREDIETSLSDYHRALSILERLVEPDSRLICELIFRICLCLEVGSKPQEAILYCQKAIAVCKSRLQRLVNEVKSSSDSVTSSAVSEIEEGVQQSSNGSQIDKSVTDKEAEIETLTGLSGDLEKKLEDLQQLALAQNPKSILSEILGMASAKAKDAKAKDGEKGASPAVTSSSQIATATSSGGFDSPTVSTAHTNGADKVTHLGIVGRGVKRVSMSAVPVESSPTKKPALDSSSDKGEGNTS